MVNLENYEDLPDEDFLSKEDDHDWVVKEFQNLGDSCKEVLKRYYYLKQSMEEIATYFNWTTATARNNKYRCIQALKEKWKSKTSKEL